jgi:phage FluMu protein gp41
MQCPSRAAFRCALVGSVALSSEVERMGKVESIEEQIKALSPEELERFRAWFQELDWALWDEQLERGVANGKLAR